MKRTYCYITLLSLLIVVGFASMGQAGFPEQQACTSDAFTPLVLTTDDLMPVTVTIQSVSTGTTSSHHIPYCLVKVKVPNPSEPDNYAQIWVGLPMGGNWNGRLQSEGGGVYCGTVSTPTSMDTGYVGVQTDTGHQGSSMSGSFGMTPSSSYPSTPNIPLQQDYAYRSEHLMAYIGKQLAQYFYGMSPLYSYWNGCSTGGRQGLAMVQRYPHDYNGVLSGASAINYDRFQAAHAWMPTVWYNEIGTAVSSTKLNLATNAAVAACDGFDGVVDGVLTDPRTCKYDARALVTPSCTRTTNTCLTAGEAAVINKIWDGPRNTAGQRLWYGEPWGTSLTSLAGSTPFVAATEQAKYWVYYNPNWDWHTLTEANYEAFFAKTITEMAPGGTATDNPNIAAFRDAGGKLLMWHGYSDQLIMAEGSIDYYDRVVRTLGGGYQGIRSFVRLFMAPGVGHCSGGSGPQPQGQFDALVNWVENGAAPSTLLASKTGQTRPLCMYPEVAAWTGSGDMNAAVNFTCVPPISMSIVSGTINFTGNLLLVRVNITVPAGYTITYWNLNNVRLQGVAPTTYSCAGSSCTAVFNRNLLPSTIVAGDSVPVTLTGTFDHNGPAQVQATAYVKVIR